MLATKVHSLVGWARAIPFLVGPPGDILRSVSRGDMNFSKESPNNIACHKNERYVASNLRKVSWHLTLAPRTKPKALRPQGALNCTTLSLPETSLTNVDLIVFFKLTCFLFT